MLLSYRALSALSGIKLVALIWRLIMLWIRHLYAPFCSVYVLTSPFQGINVPCECR